MMSYSVHLVCLFGKTTYTLKLVYSPILKLGILCLLKVSFNKSEISETCVFKDSECFKALRILKNKNFQKVNVYHDSECFKALRILKNNVFRKVTFLNP
jgi:hypothetical protein